MRKRPQPKTRSRYKPIAAFPFPLPAPAVNGLKETGKNMLYYGDNIDILRRKIASNTVDLCYIDPPFNSKRNYNQIYNNLGKEDPAQAQAFVDTWTWDTDAEMGIAEIMSNYNEVFTHQSIDLINGLSLVLGKGSLLAYLVHMTLRIAEIHRVLKPTGSFYLHCDQSACHYLKIIIDAIFCAREGEFQNEIVWKRTGAHSDAKQGRIGFGRVTDSILFYTKTKKCAFNYQYLAHNLDYLKASYKYKDQDGRIYRLDNLTGPGEASKGNPFYEFLGVSRHWRYSKEKMQTLYEEGRVIQTKPGNVPAYKRYLDESKGVEVCNTWLDIPPLQSSDAERLGYPTQKPEKLMERIIEASTNPGDIVLDAYCGCGTTIAVAERLNRRWIGIDITYQSISLILRRLGKSAMNNIEISGVPRDVPSAEALAHKKEDKPRKEFEKWAVLTYSEHRAAINEKGGGDGGIDGIGYVKDYDEKGREMTRRILFSVKSDKVLPPAKIRELNGTIAREKAAAGIMITLYPMPNLVKESKKYDFYTNEMTGQTYPRIQVVSVHEMLFEPLVKIPLIDAVKDAQRKSKNIQRELQF